jgi:hypothetical protein
MTPLVSTSTLCSEYSLLILLAVVFMSTCIYSLLILLAVVFMSTCIYSLLLLLAVVFMSTCIYSLLLLFLAVVFMPYTSSCCCVDSYLYGKGM